jgi:hypothetical protein
MDEALNVETVVEQPVIQGTSDTVVDQILAFREEVGDFGTLLYAGHDWMDQRLARRSMELMAEKVIPAVNKAITPRPPSPEHGSRNLCHEKAIEIDHSNR